jgi:hypothetical protein
MKIVYILFSIDIMESGDTEPKIVGCSKLLLSTKVYYSIKHIRLLLIKLISCRRPIDVVNDSCRYECNITSTNQLLDLTNSAATSIGSELICKLL